MKKSIFLIACLFIAIGCSKESSIVDLDQNVVQRAPGSTVDVCHKTGSGNWNIINVNENALAGHIAHGDVALVDNDGDGWVVELNECLPGGDCDDNDPAIYPGNGCDGDNACPCFSLSEVLSIQNETYYDYRIFECAGPIVGFTQVAGPNYGVLPLSQIGVDPAGNVHVGLTSEETAACVQIMEDAQANLNLPPFCVPGDGSLQTVLFITID